jgi:hypothetical protein
MSLGTEQRRSHPMMMMMERRMAMADPGLERKTIGLKMHGLFLWSSTRRPPSRTWRMQCQSLWDGLFRIVEMV